MVDAFIFRIAEGNVGAFVQQKTNAGVRSEEVENWRSPALLDSIQIGAVLCRYL